MVSDTALTIGVLILLPVLAFLPGLIEPWQLWHSMTVMFVLGIAGLIVHYGRGA